MRMPPEHVRAWIYRVALAVIAILVFYDIVAGDSQHLWELLLAAVLGLGPTGLATANTSTTKEPHPGGDV